MALTLTDEQKVALSVVALDARGNPTTTLDAAPSWSVSDPDVAAITAAADGMSAALVAGAKLGTAQVTVQATVGGAALTGTLDVTVVASAAASLSIQAAAPEAQ